MSEWLEPDTVVISEASLQGQGTTYQITIPNLIITAWLEPDTVVISEASLQGQGTTYQITIPNLIITALLDTGQIYQFFQKSSSGHHYKHLNY